MKAEQIKQCRLQTGLSQAEFAQKFRMNLRKLQDWETGKRKPNIMESLTLQGLQDGDIQI